MRPPLWMGRARLAVSSGLVRGIAMLNFRTSLMARVARHAGLRHFRFFERALAAGAAPPTGEVELRMVAESEAAVLALDPALELRRQSLDISYRRGDLCVAAFEGSSMVGYCWLAFCPLPHLDGVSVNFAEHVVWTYRSFVRPSHRGRGIAPALYRYADAECRARSRTLSVVCVESHNAASVSAARRAGYGSAGQALYIRRSSSVRAWYSDAVSRNGVVFFVRASAS